MPFKIQNILFFFLFALLFLALSVFAFSQNPTKLQFSPDGKHIIKVNDSLEKRNLLIPVLNDSSNLKLSTQDSIALAAIRKNKIKKVKSGIDTTVIYHAKDTVIFNVKKKTMSLYGNSRLQLKFQKLEADVIDLDFNNSMLKATFTKDSNKKNIGYPKFTDKGESFVGADIGYNFKTKQGTITQGETELSEGFYFGKKIKRLNENELFVQDGCYTTCDAAHPHFYFGSPEMKVIANDRVFLDPIYFYVEDLPVFMVPFGLFFPNKSGRQSGLLIPTFFFSQSRGVVFQDFGAYLALSDYYDTQFKMDYFSKGGYTFKNLTRWKMTNEFEGILNLEYGKTRMSTESPYQQVYKLNLNHNQAITPQSRLVGNISFMSQNYFGNTSMNQLDQYRQIANSNASYSESFDNGISYSLALTGDQNIKTKEYHLTFPGFNLSIPQWKPLQSFFSSDNWLKDVAVSYNVSGNYYQESIQQFTSIYNPLDSITTRDTTYKNNHRSSISHSPSISISPKFGYFTVTPSVNFRANNYFRRLTRNYNSIDSTTIENNEPGFFTEYTYGVSLAVQTRIYGIIKPKLFGINAVRHTFQPNVSISYAPDQSSSDQGFYGHYFDLKQNKIIQYSRFEADNGGIASSRKSQSMNFSILNSFDAKIKQNDTTPDADLKFFDWTLHGAYNFAADSLKFSDITMSFRIPDLRIVSLSSDAAFTVYDEIRGFDSIRHQYTDSYTQVNDFLIAKGRGLMRLRSFNLSLNTSFSSEGISIGGNTPAPATTKKDSVGLGDRFQKRQEYTEGFFDSFGDHTSGFSPLNIPWRTTIDVGFQYFRPKTTSLNLTLTLSFQLTPTWNFDGRAQYDFLNKKLLAPSLSIHKTLHCWDLSFNWYPGAGYYLRFGILAPQLSDLKIDKRNSPIY